VEGIDRAVVDQEAFRRKESRDHDHEFPVLEDFNVRFQLLPVASGLEGGYLSAIVSEYLRSRLQSQSKQAAASHHGYENGIECHGHTSRFSRVMVDE